MASLFMHYVLVSAIVACMSVAPPKPPTHSEPTALVLVQPGALGHVTAEAELARIAAQRV